MRMVKKIILALPVVALTSSAMALPASSFIKGAGIGVNVGYQFNKSKNDTSNSLKVNTPDIGVHFDYNWMTAPTMYWGLGGEVNYALKSKKTKFTTVTANDSTFTAKRTATGALTARLGAISNNVAFDVNFAVLLTSWDLDAAQPGGKESDSVTRFGFGPGVNMAFSVAKNMSIGLGYRWEIFPSKNHKFKGATDATKLTRADAHKVMIKFTYHV